MSRASHLANIYGTEADKINCPFYAKMGACRHGPRCSRKHNQPTFSQTISIVGLYTNPRTLPAGDSLDEEIVQKAFEEFYEDVYIECLQYGEIERMVVCDNHGEHLRGRVYVKFEDEEAAAKAVIGLSLNPQTGLPPRIYAGRPILVELSPVTDFEDARCKQFENADCKFGDSCNFLHIKSVGRSLRRFLSGGGRSPRRDGRDRDY